MFAEEKERISKNNMKLAQEIFKIMDGPGIISEILVKTYNNHPGTNNFGARLNEAKRIHYENRFMANRLDNVQPYYQFTKLQNSPKKKSVKLKKPSHAPKRKNHYKPKPGSSSSVPTSPRSIRTAPPAHRRDHYAGERKYVSSASTGQRDGPPKPKNLIMEHWKIQNGRVLDVAVLKEPFEDRFSLLGIDVDDGQRYQLSLSSEEVSNILEGDMLVTSFDNHEVWLALIEKVNLRPVMAFVKPGSAPIAVTASVSLVDNQTHPEAGNNGSVDSGVSSITGQPTVGEGGDSVAQQEKSLADDWGSLMNMPAIDVPISSYGVDPEYADEFEDADDQAGAKGDTLPIISNSIAAGDDTTGLEAAPPPFDFPLTRPSRPGTAVRGSSTSVAADTSSERGRRDSRSNVVPEPGAPLVLEGGGDVSVNIDPGSATAPTAGVSVTVVEESGDMEKSTKSKLSNEGKPAPLSPEKNGRRVSPRKSMLVSKLEKQDAPPLVNVPWNSNVLVTKVRERMKEISAVEQEIIVKRRATEYKLKKEQMSEHCNKISSDGNGENTEDGNSPSVSPQKVYFKPEPPSHPRPSAPGGDKSGSFKSARGRRPTGFPPKNETEEGANVEESKKIENEAAEASITS